MSTFLELQTEVRTNIIDLPTAVTNLVPTYLNRAMVELQNKHNFKVMEGKTAVLSTVLDTRQLSVCPTDFKEWRGKPLLMDALGPVRELSIADDLNSAALDFGTELGGEADNQTLSGPPFAIFRDVPSNDAGATVFQVFPLPDGLSIFLDGEYRILIPYWRYLTPLSADSDTNWFTTHAAEWLIFKATAAGFFADWDDQRATTWSQRAGDKWQEVVNLDKRLRVSQVDTLIPQSDVLGSKLGFQGIRRQWRRW